MSIKRNKVVTILIVTHSAEIRGFQSGIISRTGECQRQLCYRPVKNDMDLHAVTLCQGCTSWVADCTADSSCVELCASRYIRGHPETHFGPGLGTSSVRHTGVFRYIPPPCRGRCFCFSCRRSSDSKGVWRGAEYDLLSFFLFLF